MNQQETEQFAALRMHVAHLHNALRDAHALQHPEEPAFAIAAVALAESEPHVRELLAEADRDAKLVAARAELQSQGQALAQVTARLAKIEGAAKLLVTVYDEPHDAELVKSRVLAFAEALK